MPHSELKYSKKPLTIAIDIGTSSVRAVAFDAAARQVRNTEHRERYKLEITPDGGSMCDPHHIRRLVAKCLQKCCLKLGSCIGDVAVIGVSCHWHSLMGLDSKGESITPVYMWNDKRSSADADALVNELPPNMTHARTGCRLHSSYWPAKLRWLQRTRLQIAEAVVTWCGLADWLLVPDGDLIATTVSTASATGLMHTSELAWDDLLINYLAIDIDSLPAIEMSAHGLEPEQVHPDLRIECLKAVWFPPIGDGAAANIGAGAIGTDRIALTIGTSGAIRLIRQANPSTPLESGLFRYLIDEQTEVVGGALSNGGNMIAWLTKLTQSKDRQLMMKQAAALAPDEHGLTILPFFAGERAPSWQDRIGGTITGMSLGTSEIHILRAMMEATALRFSRVYQDILPFADQHHTIIANGGALLQSPLWCQITADALGCNISALNSRSEASARGAAIIAMYAGGILSSLRVDPQIDAVYWPNPESNEIYRNARRRLESLEAALNTWEQGNRDTAT